MDKADLVIKSNAVFTGDGLAPFKGGVAVAGDRIVACGEDKYLDAFIGPDTEVRDYGDKLVMPGIIDSHTHYAQGAFLTDPDFAVNLIDCTSFERCMERVQAFAKDHPNNEWIVGCQVIQFQWDVPEMPTATMIDEYISDRPVFLQQVDMHTFSANTCAIEKSALLLKRQTHQAARFLRMKLATPLGSSRTTREPFSWMRYTILPPRWLVLPLPRLRIAPTLSALQQSAWLTPLL